MSKLAKGIVLIVTLGLPVAIYLFLQAFGENRYALPVFPELETATTDCGPVTPGYTVKKLTCDSVDLVVLGDDQNYLFHFPDANTPDLPGEMNEMRRLVEETKGADYKLVSLVSDGQYDRWDKLAADEAKARYWAVTSACADLTAVKNCQLLLSLANIKWKGSESSLVLVDGRGRVRGFFPSAQKDEIDRLLIELDVLMQEK